MRLSSGEGAGLGVPVGVKEEEGGLLPLSLFAPLVPSFLSPFPSSFLLLLRKLKRFGWAMRRYTSSLRRASLVWECRVGRRLSACAPSCACRSLWSRSCRCPGPGGSSGDKFRVRWLPVGICRAYINLVSDSGHDFCRAFWVFVLLSPTLSFPLSPRPSRVMSLCNYGNELECSKITDSKKQISTGIDMFEL